MEPVSDKKPVMLTADRIDYFQSEDRVVASGKVEVVQGDTVLLCDELTYDRAQNLVIATGNVSMVEAAGNVVFANSVELRDNLQTGVVDAFKARLSDDSLFAARSGRKLNEYVTELDDAG